MTEEHEQTSTTVEALCKAICDGMLSGIDVLQSAEFWPQVGRRIALPAAFLEVAGFKPGEDPGTGETALVVHIQARLVVDPVPGAGDIQAATLASSLIRLLHNQQWGLPIAPAELISAAPEWMSPELESYICWAVEWTHELHIGEVTWPWEDSSGVTLYLGVDPDTGPGNEPLYWPAGDDPHPEA